MLQVGFLCILLSGESDVDFRTHWVIMTQGTRPPPPAISVIFRFLTKLIVVIKTFKYL